MRKEQWATVFLAVVIIAMMVAVFEIIVMWEKTEPVTVSPRYIQAEVEQ